MTELTALEKHSCPLCGAQAEWNPSKHKLICPYCGTESPYQIDPDSGEVREIDLVRTLREMPETRRGWDSKRRSVKCRSCRAVSVFEPERVGQRCEFCGSPELVDYEEIQAPLRPESLLPFKIGESQVRESLRAWYAAKWFAPNALKNRALVDTVHGVYLPYWTFDAEVYCPWTAEAGHYYYTTQSYTDSNGRRRTRQVRHVRWTNASGSIQHSFDDELVSGSRGIEPGLLRQVEPFPTDKLVPYDTAYLSGLTVEHYQVVLFTAAESARQNMDSHLRGMCGAQVPGDTYRNLQIYPEYSDQTFKYVLLPVWLLTYNYSTGTYQILVNGFTGRIAGQYPKSFWKIASLIFLILLAVALAIWLSS
jgi:Zn finger protein HypA/HybF involved in hydrogenase expression